MSDRLQDLGFALAKLERRTPFSKSARAAFLGLPFRRVVHQDSRDFVGEGDATPHCCFLESGFVSRSKMLPSGARQIVSFHLAGDLVGLQSALLRLADHSLHNHGPAVTIEIGDKDILRLAADYPEIGRAFWFETLVDSSIFKEWELNLGRRDAKERLAHLIVEMGYRSEEAGLGQKDDFFFPITQFDLADALGLTAVHVNRTMQWLRSADYLRDGGRRMIILNWQALSDLAAFQPLYLHTERPKTLR